MNTRVDAGRHAGARQRLDVLGEPAGDAVAGARQLQAVRDVEDHRVAQRAQHRQRRACRRRGCCSRRTMPRSVSRMPRAPDALELARPRAACRCGARNWPFLTLTGLPVLRGRDEQVGLPAEERRNLQHVDDFRRRRGVRRLVNVGEHGQPGARLDLGQRLRARRRARGRETTTARCGWPCRTTP